MNTTDAARMPASRRMAALLLACALLALPGITACTETGSGTASTEAEDATVSAESSTTVSTATTATTLVTHDESGDYVWDDADVVEIALAESSASCGSDAVAIEGSDIAITAPGTYRLTGALDDGAVAVASSGDGVVRLLLSGADITNSDGPAISVTDAEKVVVVLVNGTDNRLSDGATYAEAAADADAPNATLYSTADLTIFGEGSLTVTGLSNDGIASKDGLIIASGAITIDAADDGVRGKDYVLVKDGSLTVVSGGDGIKSDNDEEAGKGVVAIADGEISITAEGDGIDAATDVSVVGGALSVVSCGCAGATLADDASAKGVKGTSNVVISGGDITIDSADDAIHSNGAIAVSGGTMLLSSGDDGMHADTSIDVTGGAITVARAYEGIESARISIGAGTIDITCDDDGLNAGGGADSSGMTPGGAPGDTPGVTSGGAGRGRDHFSSAQGGETESGDYLIAITGGTITIDAEGDGVDSNGSIEMSGGTVVVHGPSRSGNGALDCNGTFDVAGGTIVAVSSTADMMESITSPSTQPAIAFTLGSAVSAGTPIRIENADGTAVLTLESTKDIAAVVFTSPDLTDGESYEVLLGGSVSGESVAGLYTAPTYEAGQSAGSVEAALP